jgi:hypothetical protein
MSSEQSKTLKMVFENLRSSNAITSVMAKHDNYPEICDAFVRGSKQTRSRDWSSGRS